MASPKKIPDRFEIPLEKNGEQVGKAVARHCDKGSNGIATKLYWVCLCNVPADWVVKLKELSYDDKPKIMEKLFKIKSDALDFDTDANVISWHSDTETTKEKILKKLDKLYTVTTTTDCSIIKSIQLDE